MLKISYRLRGRKKNKESARERKREVGEQHTLDVHSTRAITMPRHMSAATVPSDQHTLTTFKT